jgi:hypothetical protein
LPQFSKYKDKGGGRKFLQNARRKINVMLIKITSKILWEIKPLRLVKLSPITGLNRNLGLQKVEAPRLSRQSSHEGGKVVSPKHRSPLPSRTHPWYSFLLKDESTPGPSCGRKE